ncbi:MAG TPA: hypothetical protein VJ717_08635 [Gemmatimonadaceae bacterium]|nr:hypothetical protein [Gemmatimonadaceae bacterium]
MPSKRDGGMPLGASCERGGSLMPRALIPRRQRSSAFGRPLRPAFAGTAVSLTRRQTSAASSSAARAPDFSRAPALRDCALHSLGQLAGYVLNKP